MNRLEASNGFSQGLIMDYNPLGTPNNALSNALNATMITYNGNEASLQNDMGNGRVESAYLPAGFVPLGTTSFGGIIYIVSYNPLTDTCQIGSFPSPERNFTKQEANAGEITIKESDFIQDGVIKNFQMVYPLMNVNNEEIQLTPGDKFALYIEQLSTFYDFLKGLAKNGLQSSHDPNIKLVLGIKQGGLLRELGDVREYLNLIEEDSKKTLYSYIALANAVEDAENYKIDDYRKSVVDTNYNVIKCNISGTLCIIAKLITLDSFMIKSKIEFEYGRDETNSV